MRAASKVVERGLAAIPDAMAEAAREYQNTPMIGRSNLRQEVPTAFFGYKQGRRSGLRIERHRERLAGLKPRVLVEKVGGAGGLAGHDAGLWE